MDYNNKCATGCGADGSARGLGPWGRRFDPCHLDHKRLVFDENSLEFKNSQMILNKLFSKSF